MKIIIDHDIMPQTRAKKWLKSVFVNPVLCVLHYYSLSIKQPHIKSIEGSKGLESRQLKVVLEKQKKPRSTFAFVYS